MFNKPTTSSSKHSRLSMDKPAAIKGKRIRTTSVTKTNQVMELGLIHVPIPLINP